VAGAVAKEEERMSKYMRWRRTQAVKGRRDAGDSTCPSIVESSDQCLPWSLKTIHISIFNVTIAIPHRPQYDVVE